MKLRNFLCSVLGVWAINSSMADIEKSNVIECTICELIEDSISQELRNPEDEANLQDYLNNFCQELEPQYQKICPGLVNATVDTVWEWFEDHLDEYSCENIGLC